MKLALAIGHRDVRSFLRERTSFIWLLGVPLAFTFFMGFAVRDSGAPSVPHVSLRIENEDSGFLGRILAEQLADRGIDVLSPTNQQEQVSTLRIPNDFTARVLNRRAMPMDYLPGNGPEEAEAALVQLRLVRVLLQINAVLVQHALHYGTNAFPDESTLRERLASPPAVTLDSSFAGRRPVPTGFGLSVPGNLVMYLMMNLLIFGGANLAWERRSGVIRRLMVCPVRRAELVSGKIYGLILLGLVQIGLLLAVGHFVFKVHLGGNLVPILLTLAIYSWVAAALGVFLGSWIRSEDKIIGLCIVLSLTMAALGGCWWPLEIVPDSVRTLAHVVPSGWAMDALHQLISFGGGWQRAAPGMGVLVLYALAATLAAARSFRA